jgi:hypothetical protein
MKSFAAVAVVPTFTVWAAGCFVTAGFVSTVKATVFEVLTGTVPDQLAL